MKWSEAGRFLAAYIKSLPDFTSAKASHCSYQHMGATLCDAGLQAGLNYRTVVAPRIRKLISVWPFATITSSFVRLMEEQGLETMLTWRHPEKLKRIRDWSLFFICEQVESECDLRDWLTNEANVRRLRDLRGMGPKTVDYLQMLVGVPTVAVDRHIRSFVAAAGINAVNYDDVKRVVEAAADDLGVPSSRLDYRIWLYMSNGSKPHRLHKQFSGFDASPLSCKVGDDCDSPTNWDH